ncbi:hypothetical protein JCM11641_002422 [Rhodosporidiobolus odoratus]
MPAGAAAALLAAALPQRPPNHPEASGSRARGRGRGRAAGVRGLAAMDEDTGMSDGHEAGAKRRGRQVRSSGPMGERPARGRNSPAVISDKPTRTSAASTSKTGKSTDPPSASTVDVLRLFILARYSQPDRMLNMENMAEDPVLKEHKLLAPGQPGAPSNMAGAIWKLAKEMCPDVISLSLANNALTSLLPLSPFLLTSSLPNIENVSFAANNLSQFRDLDPFSPLIGKERKDKKPKGWSKLKELVLTGNPIIHSGGTTQTYEREMARRFSTLRTLDQKPLDPTVAFSVAQKAAEAGATPGLSSRVKSEKSKQKEREHVTFPVEIKGGFHESDQTRDFIGGFFLKFFAAFDSDRPSLLSVYAPVCSFSLHADTSYPARARAKKIGINGDKRFPNQHKLDWKHYLTPEGSRNLQRVKVPEKRVNTMHLNPSSVITAIVNLPKTQHPLDQSEKFVWDCWTMPAMLAPTQPGGEAETVIYASVHGEFTEFPSQGIRSFDRNFILAPAPAGSTAQAAGWPCIILSDLLTLRGYSDLSFSKPRPPPQPKAAAPPATTGPAPVVAPVPPAMAGPSFAAVAAAPPPAAPPAAAAAAPLPGLGQERAEGITDEQQNLVLQLQQVTRLNYTFAHLCLSQNGWDPHQALAQFQTLQGQGSIPAEAFLSVA